MSIFSDIVGCSTAGLSYSEFWSMSVIAKVYTEYIQKILYSSNLPTRDLPFIKYKDKYYPTYRFISNYTVFFIMGISELDKRVNTRYLTELGALENMNKAVPFDKLPEKLKEEAKFYFTLLDNLENLYSYLKRLESIARENNSTKTHPANKYDLSPLVPFQLPNVWGIKLASDDIKACLAQKKIFIRDSEETKLSEFLFPYNLMRT